MILIDSVVQALNGEAKTVGKVMVVKVMNPKRKDRTPVIPLLDPKDLVMEIRHIRF